MTNEVSLKFFSNICLNMITNEEVGFVCTVSKSMLVHFSQTVFSKTDNNLNIIR